MIVPAHVTAGSQVIASWHVEVPKHEAKSVQVACVPQVGNPAAPHVWVPSHVGDPADVGLFGHVGPPSHVAVPPQVCQPGHVCASSQVGDPGHVVERHVCVAGQVAVKQVTADPHVGVPVASQEMAPAHVALPSQVDDPAHVVVPQQDG